MGSAGRPDLSGCRGDPVKLTDQQRSLLGQLHESLKGGGRKHSPNAHSWVDSVKGFFEKMGL